MIIKDDKRILAEQIKYIRKKSGYTQKELAEIISVSRAAIASYEVGRNRPDIDVLVEIAKACNCKVDDIINTPVDSL